MSAPPRVKLDYVPAAGAGEWAIPLTLVVELENLTATPSARYDIWWGDNASIQGTTAVSATHLYPPSAGTYTVRVRIKDPATGFYGYDQSSIYVWRPAPSAEPDPPEGVAPSWLAVRSLNPTQPAFQVRRKSRAIH